MHAVQEIFLSRSIPLSWGKTLLCLIPKINNAHMPSHFKPLGLCNTYYKILANLIFNRLKPHLHSLISPFQGAFTPVRHSSYLFLVAQETMHSMYKSTTRNDWVILKIDVRKAFDTILWSFIEQNSPTSSTHWNSHLMLKKCNPFD